MRELEKAMAEEKRYVADRMQGVDTSLLDRLQPYGYDTLGEYFAEKKAREFERWVPEVRRTDIANVAAEVERAIREEDYGVYIPTVSGTYAFHGEGGIDEDECRRLGVRPVNMGYRGGVIIGSDADFAIEIVAPASLQLTGGEILSKIAQIIGRYMPDVTISGNDILVSGEKIMGSMERRVGNVYAWACQISFGEYADTIARLCKKPAAKKPGRIDKGRLSRDKLEREVLKWLRKQ